MQSFAPRPTTSMPMFRLRPWGKASTCIARSRLPIISGRRRSWTGWRPGRCRHADGQLGPFARRHPADVRVDLGRGHRPGAERPRLGERRAMEQDAAGNAQRETARARRRPLGPVDRPARARALSSGIHAGHVARLLGIRHGGFGDFGCHDLDAACWGSNSAIP